MKLDEDLQRILNVGAKVYHVKDDAQGKVQSVDDESVRVEFGELNQSYVKAYKVDEFKQMLVDDQIVANYRLTMGQGSKFKVMPRAGSDTTRQSSTKPAAKSNQSTQPKLETGYINFKIGKFSTESKRGYTKVEYRKATQKVTLEIDEDQLRKLKEMGLV